MSGDKDVNVLPVFFSADNAVLCYSCMAMPPQYANVDTKELIDHLRWAGTNLATNQTIHLPAINGQCRETHVTAQGQFLDTTKFICQTGACVKLKGIFQGMVQVCDRILPTCS